MLEIKLLSGSEIEIDGEISVDVFESFRQPSIKELSEEVKINGFRPGKIPEKILTERIGEPAILERMALLSIKKEYPKIIEKHKIRAIGRPQITITKLARNNPLGFKIKTYVMPEVELTDYKKIKVLEKIVEEAKMEIPKILLEAEAGDEKHVKTSLVLNEIAEREKIKVNEEELSAEMEKIMSKHKDIDRERLKVYIYGVIRNQKVIKFLETC